MPLHLRFGAEDLLRCRFAISPLCETHEAVRTLSRVERHGYHAPWLRRMRTAVAGLELSALWLLTPRGGYTPDFLAPPPDAPFASFEEELARMRATEPELARIELTRSLVGVRTEPSHGWVGRCSTTRPRPCSGSPMRPSVPGRP